MPAIRFATLVDLPDIRRLWTAMMHEVPQTYPGDMLAPETVDEFTRQAARVLADPAPVTFCLVATDETQSPVGFHCFGYQTRDLGTPHLIVFCYWIYVVPEYRNTPLVEDLAELAVEHALSRGVTHVEMSRIPGMALRKGLGFEPFETRAQAPCTLILTRIEERRRRRAARAARVPPELESAGNGLDHDVMAVPPPLDDLAAEEEG